MFTVTIVTMAMVTCATVILPINHQISQFLFYFSLQVILKPLVKIMPFNNRKLISVRRCGK